MSVTPNGDTFNYTRNGANKVAEMVAAVSVNPDGSAQSALAPGPATAGQSVPTTEAAYSSAAQYTGSPTTVGRAVAFICTAAGTATLTFPSGSLVIPVSVGLTVLPFACTNAVQTTGSMTIFKLI